VRAPGHDERHALLQTPVTRRLLLLTRRGVRAEEMGPTSPTEPDADGDQAHTLRPTAA